jgi:hypothetical protein
VKWQRKIFDFSLEETRFLSTGRAKIANFCSSSAQKSCEKEGIIPFHTIFVKDKSNFTRFV